VTLKITTKKKFLMRCLLVSSASRCTMKRVA
jgi:hypothetical protein